MVKIKLSHVHAMIAHGEWKCNSSCS